MPVAIYFILSPGICCAFMYSQFELFVKYIDILEKNSYNMWQYGNNHGVNKKFTEDFGNYRVVMYLLYAEVKQRYIIIIA